jgi:hypothetical protein
VSRILVICTTSRPPEMTRRVRTRLERTALVADHEVIIRWVYDGRSKSEKLNVIREDVRRDSESNPFSIVVVMDDDILVPPHWDRDVALALVDYVAIGLDLSNTQEGADYMCEVNPPMATDRGVYVRPVHRMNVAGAFIATSFETFLNTPPYPWDGKTQYELDEDYFRCQYIRNQGGILGYVVCESGNARILTYEDSPEYLQRKAEDIDYIRNVRGIATL